MVLAESDKEKYFSSLTIFERIPSTQLGKVASSGSIEHHKAGSILFSEQESIGKFTGVVSGEISLTRKAFTGELKQMAVLGPGDSVGENALVDELYHTTSALVTANAALAVIPISTLTAILNEDPGLSSSLMRNIARKSLFFNKGVKFKEQPLYALAHGKMRNEHDLLGDLPVSADALYGIQTFRAVQNFNISGINLSFYPELIESLAMVKLAAVRANYDLHLIPKQLSDAISQACEEIIRGRFHDEFIVDMMQGGAGTSTNMNANEVIANRALIIMGLQKGDYNRCHPNNHVNLSQSTNDVYPTAIKIALCRANGKLLSVLRTLIEAMRKKAREFQHVLKMGRTQLQDAVPMTLGQSFEAYAVTLGEEIDRLEQNVKLLMEVNMGATAIGTGINTHPKYQKRVVDYLKEITGLPLVSASNLIEATQDTGAFVMYAASIKRLAIKLSKICNDLRLLSSGPVAGINEINLPPMQPGSSIMPGKVNPVIPEVVNQIAFRVIGNELTITMAAEAGQLELNVMEPVIAFSLFESIEMLKNGMATLTLRCIDGITANERRSREMVQNSISIVTALNPILGYEVCSALAREALQSQKSVYSLVLDKKLLSQEILDKVLSPESMTKPSAYVVDSNVKSSERTTSMI